MNCMAFSMEISGGRREDEMDVIGHDDEIVELEAALGAVLLEHADHECGVLVDLEETAAARHDRCSEEGAESLWREWHQRDSGAEAAPSRELFRRAKALHFHPKASTKANASLAPAALGGGDRVDAKRLREGFVSHDMR